MRDCEGSNIKRAPVAEMFRMLQGTRNRSPGMPTKAEVSSAFRWARNGVGLLMMCDPGDARGTAPAGVGFCELVDMGE